MDHPAINTWCKAANVPNALKQLPQWVNWKPVWKESDGKYTKVPFTPLGKPASSTDSNMWSAVSDVIKASDESTLASEPVGVGFVLSADDPYIGVDLDKCRDAKTGEIEAWARDIAAELNSYTEVSPSGTGLRIILLAGIPEQYLTGEQGGRRKGRIEVYQSKRFLTITGDRVEGFPSEPQGRQGELEVIMMGVFGKRHNGSGVHHGNATTGAVEPRKLPETKLKAIRQHPKFKDTWGRRRDPDWSASEYDLALANIATECGCDLPETVAIIHLWRKEHGENPDKILRADIQQALWSKVEGRVQQEWPEITPINVSLPPVESFSFSLLPDALRPWAEDIVSRQQCPPDFVAVSVMAALSSLIGRKTGIYPKQYDDWLVVPNLWAALIGRPSSGKSPAMEESLRHIRRLAADAHQQHLSDLESFEITKIANSAKLEKAQGEIKKAVNTGKGLELAKSEALEARQDREPAPTEKRYIVNDVTIEKLGELLNENPTGLLLVRDELIGWLRSLDREDRASDRAFYLEAFNGGGSFSYDRIGRGTVHIQSTAVSILGGIQPSRLQPYIWHAVNQGIGDDGLMQRFQLAVYPDANGKDFNPVDRWPDKAAKDRAWEIFRNLAAFEGLEGEDGRPHALRFSPDAQVVFNEWRHDLETKIREPDIHPAIEAHLIKYRSLMPSIALIVHIVDNGQDEPVSKDAALKAVCWCEYLESHAHRIYGSAPYAAAQSAATIVARRDRLPDQFKVRDIRQKGWAGLSETDSVKAAVMELEESGYIRQIPQERSSTGGRPTAIYEWNPGVE